MLIRGQTVRPLVLALGHRAAVAVLAPRLHLAPAARRVHTGAGIVLRVARIGARLRHGCTWIRRACRCVLAGVEFERVAAPIGKQIVASEDWRLNVADA